MAGIKAPILDILNRLQSLQAFAYVRIWNNQLQNLEEGKMEAFPSPAAFLEVMNDPTFEELGVGFQSADLAFRIHIYHEQIDAQDGTFAQDLVVFDLRDAVVRSLSLFQPTACGPMTKIAEFQDYDHSNMYHYQIDFMANFTDSTGSPYDPNSCAFVEKPAPTTLNVNVQVVDSIDGVESNSIFPHPGYKPYIPQS